MCEILRKPTKTKEEIDEELSDKIAEQLAEARKATEQVKARVASGSNITQAEIDGSILKTDIVIDKEKALQERYINPATKPPVYKPSLFRKPPIIKP